MEQLKKEISEIILRYSYISDTQHIINSYDINNLIEDIIKIVEYNFEERKCMPDEINTKEEYEEYLIAIGHDKYLEELKLI